jgi:hypothetical protein
MWRVAAGKGTVPDRGWSHNWNQLDPLSGESSKRISEVVATEASAICLLGVEPEGGRACCCGGPAVRSGWSV